MLMESEALHHLTYIKNLDLKEGIQSFLEKRKPQWKHDTWDDLPNFIRLKYNTKLRMNPKEEPTKSAMGRSKL